MEFENVYVTYTCKNPECRCAFVDIDPLDNINELPLKTRYCPECVKKGFKNPPMKKRPKEVLVFEACLKEFNITDEKDIQFLRKKYNKDVSFKKSIGAKFTLKGMFKEALEVLGYQEWKQ